MSTLMFGANCTPLACGYAVKALANDAAMNTAAHGVEVIETRFNLHRHAACPSRALRIVGDTSEAHILPLVSCSNLSAKSGGQSKEWRSCESLPFEMPTASLKTVNESASGCKRYKSIFMGYGLVYLNIIGQVKSLASPNDLHNTM